MKPRDRGNDAQHAGRVARLRRGDLVLVRFGGKGAQLAEVLGPARADRSIPVRKWRRKSARWTLRTFIRAGEIVSIPSAPHADTLRRWGVEQPTNATARAATAAAQGELRALFGRLG